MAKTSKTCDMGNLTWAQAKGMRDEQSWVDMGKVTLERAAEEVAGLARSHGKKLSQRTGTACEARDYRHEPIAASVRLKNHSITLERIAAKTMDTSNGTSARRPIHLFHKVSIEQHKG